MFAGGADPNDPKYQPGFEDADTSVVAAVPVYGRYDWFTTEGEGRREFVQLLEKFVVKRNSPPTATSTSTPRRSGGCGPTRRRSSSCTAATIP